MNEVNGRDSSTSHLSRHHATTEADIEAAVQEMAAMLAQSLAIANRWRERVDTIANEIDATEDSKDTFRHWLGVRSAFRMTIVRLEDATNAHRYLQRALEDRRAKSHTS
ncbi:MAG: hypothetical protein ACO1RT_11190 [Planctomycetaceae bacterium]